MIPMGTVVTVCMFAGLLMAARLPIMQKCPVIISKLTGCVVGLAGLWNVLWYGVQHLGEFWGFSALVSGVLMVITAIYILDESRLPSVLQRARPVVLVILLGYAMLYAITIARL